MAFVYRLVHKKTGKFYIGSAASDATGTPRPTLSYRAHSSNQKFANTYYLSDVKQPERKRATTIENVRVKGRTKRR